MTEGELRAELVTLTNMSEAEWSDFLEMPPEAQAVAVENYRDARWVKSPDVLAKVLSVLTLLGTIAGVVSGVSGAVTAVRTLVA